MILARVVKILDKKDDKTHKGGTYCSLVLASVSLRFFVVCYSMTRLYPFLSLPEGVRLIHWA